MDKAQLDIIQNNSFIQEDWDFDLSDFDMNSFEGFDFEILNLSVINDLAQVFFTEEDEAIPENDLKGNKSLVYGREI